MFLEVIGLTAEDVVAAQNGGANRIELVSSMSQDGLSPSFETIEKVLAVASIPVRAMVRFHNDGFVYTDIEKKEMIQWIKRANAYDLDGYVIGALTPTGAVDEVFLQEAIEAADGKNITFHRAFDRAENMSEALEVIKKYPVQTILTSAGIARPIKENLIDLQQLQAQAPSIEILAGGGVNESVIRALKETNVQHFHVGGAVRPSGDFMQTIDRDLVAEILTI